MASLFECPFFARVKKAGSIIADATGKVARRKKSFDPLYT